MTKLTKLYEVLHWASLFLKENNCEEKIAEILLQHHLAVTRNEFYMMMREPISKEIIGNFKSDIKKHVATGIPVQHLIGYEIFYGRKFSVNKHVLVPRPETEELVQRVIEMANKYPQTQPITIVDIGTGSGVIAITLALEIPYAKIYATDISKEALQVAQHNAEQLHANVNFLQGDYLQPVIDHSIGVDIIVSNPPYISSKEESTLSRTVKNFDPKIALFAEEDGLIAYRKILQLAKQMQQLPDMIFFEIGYEQGDMVQTMVKKIYPHSYVDIRKDINGNDRIVVAKLT